MDTIILYVLLGLVAINLGLTTYLLVKKPKPLINDINQSILNLDNKMINLKTKLDEISTSTDNKFANNQVIFNNAISNLQTNLSQLLNIQIAEESKKEQQKLDLLINSLTERLKVVEQALSKNTEQTEQKLETIRQSMEKSIKSLENENSLRLEKMRETVDEKLQKTLEERLAQSFKMVNDNLTRVYQGIGEVQTLASSVGDLKKVLTNVKTKGIWGEVQLGSILDQILAVEQYDKDVTTKPGSKDRVEYAVKIPNQFDNSFVYLPIDAKFPLETYEKLINAYDRNDKDAIDANQKELTNKIKRFAKDIQDKYINTPNTTDFAIMFLPLEGLYAEVVQLGLVEDIHRDYRISISGPTTMAALLNALQMGFRSIAITKRTSEVWDLLHAIKNEFGNFEKALISTQNKLDQASKELESLVGVRTRQLKKKLDHVALTNSKDENELVEIE